MSSPNVNSNGANGSERRVSRRSHRGSMASPRTRQSHRSSVAHHAPSHGLIAPDGHVMTEAERAEMWRKQGKCTRCGDVVTHLVKMLRSKPLTIDGLVYKGYCLNCHDLKDVKKLLGEDPGADDHGDRDKHRQRDSLASVVKTAAATEKAEGKMRKSLLKIRTKKEKSSKSRSSSNAGESAGQNGMSSEPLLQTSADTSEPSAMRGKRSGRTVLGGSMNYDSSISTLEDYCGLGESHETAVMAGAAAAAAAVADDFNEDDDGYHGGPDMSRTMKDFSNMVLKDFPAPTTPKKHAARRSLLKRTNHDDVQRQRLMEEYNKRWPKKTSQSDESSASSPKHEVMSTSDAYSSMYHSDGSDQRIGGSHGNLLAHGNEHNMQYDESPGAASLDTALQQRHTSFKSSLQNLPELPDISGVGIPDQGTDGAGRERYRSDQAVAPVRSEQEQEPFDRLQGMRERFAQTKIAGGIEGKGMEEYQRKGTSASSEFDSLPSQSTAYGSSASSSLRSQNANIIDAKVERAVVGNGSSSMVKADSIDSRAAALDTAHEEKTSLEVSSTSTSARYDEKAREIGSTALHEMSSPDTSSSRVGAFASTGPDSEKGKAAAARVGAFQASGRGLGKKGKGMKGDKSKKEGELDGSPRYAKSSAAVDALGKQADSGDFNGVINTMRTNSKVLPVVKVGLAKLRDGVPRFHCATLPPGDKKDEMAQRQPILPNSAWVKVVTVVMSQHLKEPDVQADAARTLWAISTLNSRYMTDVTTCAGVDAILNAMKRHGDDDKVQEFCAGAISCLCGSKRHAVQVKKSCSGAALACLMTALKRPSETGSVQEWALRALFYLSIIPPSQAGDGRGTSDWLDFAINMGKHASAGDGAASSGGEGMEAAVAEVTIAMRKYVLNPGVQEWACRLLWSLSAPVRSTLDLGGDTSAGSIVASHDVVDAVTTAMSSHRSNTSLQEAACGLLSNIAAQPGLSSSSRLQPIAEAVVQSMSDHCQSSTLELYACLTVTNLCSGSGSNREIRATIATLGGITPIIKFMQDFPDVPEVQGEACNALASLCVDSPWNKEAANAAGGVTAVVAAYRAHTASVTEEESLFVREMACIALTTLATNTENLSAIKATGVLDEISNSLKENAQMPDSLKKTMHILVGAKNDGIVGGDCDEDAVSKVLQSIERSTTEEEFDRAVNLLLGVISRSRNCAQIALSMEVMDQIIRGMRSFPDSISIQDVSCRLLSLFYSKFSGAADMDLSIRSSQEIVAISHAMRGHRNHEGLQETASLALRQFCTVDPSYPKIICGEVVDALLLSLDDLVQTFKNHSASPAVLENACSALWALSFLNDTFTQAVSSSNSIAHIIEAMANFPSQKSLQFEACGALWVLSSMPENAARIGTDTGIDTIISCIDEFGSDEKIVEQCCNIIAALSSDTYRAKMALIDHDMAVSCVIDCMYKFPKSVPIQWAACATMANVSVSNYIKEDIANIGGINRIAAAMKEHDDNAFLLSMACEALCNLASGVDDDIIEGNGIVGCITRALERHPQKMTLQAHGICALWNLSVKDERFKEEVARFGGIKLVIDAMQRFIDSELIQEKAFVTLWSLGVNQSNQSKIGENGGIQAIINGMLVHVTSVEVQEEAMGALKTLATNEMNKAIISEYGGCDAIVTSMWANCDNATIQAHACSALSNIAVNVTTNQVALMSHSELEAIVSAMQTFPNEEEVQSSAILLIRNYTFAPSNLDLIRTNRVLPGLLHSAAVKYPGSCGNRANYVLGSL